MVGAGSGVLVVVGNKALSGIAEEVAVACAMALTSGATIIVGEGAGVLVMVGSKLFSAAGKVGLTSGASTPVGKGPGVSVMAGRETFGCAASRGCVPADMAFAFAGVVASWMLVAKGEG